MYVEGEEPHQGVRLGPDQLRTMSVQEIVESEPRYVRANLLAREWLINGGLSYDDLEDRKAVEIFYLYGPSGCGKSLMARRLIQEYMKENPNSLCDKVKYKNEFWLNVKQNVIAWYDEFRDSHMKPDEFISFTDYMVNPMNLKGGDTMNRYKFIVITSVQGPNDIYQRVSGEPRTQWERRIRFVNCGDPQMIKALTSDRRI